MDPNKGANKKPGAAGGNRRRRPSAGAVAKVTKGPKARRGPRSGLSRFTDADHDSVAEALLALGDLAYGAEDDNRCGVGWVGGGVGGMG